MPHHDFVIVGLGTAGSATCMTLARRGFRVLGIDALHPPHNRGSHHGASRSVRRAYLEGTVYVPMALQAWQLWRRLEADSGRKLLVKTGNLTLGPPESPAVTGFMSSAKAYDIPHEYYTAAEVRRRWPQLAPPDTLVAGLEKEAGIVFPESAIDAFLAEAQKAGAELIFHERVERWAEDCGHVRVHTASKTYEAGRLLISAGAWSRVLLGPIGEVLTPKRVSVHWFEVPQDGGFHLGRFPVNFWQVPAGASSEARQAYREFYSLPVTGPDSRVKIAFHNGLSDCDPDTLDREVPPDEAEKIKDMVARYLPGILDCPLTSEACLYTLTPDGHFFLGRRPGSDHVFGVALAGHGFKFAPVLGEILSDLLTGSPPAFDIGLFSPRRFDRRLHPGGA